MGLFLRILVNTLAIIVVGAVIPGIEVRNLLAAIAAGFLLGVINGLVRPVLILLTFPLTLLTLGLFLLVLNGLCFWLTAGLVRGLEIHGFWSALFGALFISLISFFLNGFIHDSGSIQRIRYRQ